MRLYGKNSGRSAFTLLELLVAGALLVALLTLAIGSLFTGSRASSRGIERLDEIGRIARLGEQLKRVLRFATVVRHETPAPGREELRVKFVEDASPMEGTRVERPASFAFLGTAGGPRRVEIDVAGRSQTMEFERLETAVHVSANLTTVRLAGTAGRGLELSVASPYLIVTETLLSSAAAAGPGATASPGEPPAAAGGAGAFPAGALPPAALPGTSAELPGDEPAAGLASPSSEAGSAAGPATGGSVLPPAASAVAARAGSSGVKDRSESGQPPPAASPPGFPPPPTRRWRGGSDGIFRTPLPSLPPVRQAGPAARPPAAAKPRKPAGPVLEPDVVAIDEQGAAIHRFPEAHKPGAAGAILRPILRVLTTLVNAALRQAAAGPGSPARRQPRPLPPELQKLLQSLAQGTAQKQPQRRPSGQPATRPLTSSALDRPF